MTLSDMRSIHHESHRFGARGTMSASYLLRTALMLRLVMFGTMLVTNVATASKADRLHCGQAPDLAAARLLLKQQAQAAQ
jgi:hypothetical protein